MKNVSLRVFTYNDHEITFDFSKEHKMINSTQMAKVFGKKTSDFLRQKSTKEYINALLIHLNKSVAGIPATEKDLIYTVQGGDPALQGTWLHKLLGLRAAQWLDPFFAIWVDEKIEELLVDGFTMLEPATDFRVIYFVKAKMANNIKFCSTLLSWKKNCQTLFLSALTTNTSLIFNTSPQLTAVRKSFIYIVNGNGRFP